MKLSALPSYLQPQGLPPGSDSQAKLLHRLRQHLGQVAGGLQSLKDLEAAWGKLSMAEQSQAADFLGTNAEAITQATADLIAAIPKEPKPKPKSKTTKKE